MYANDMCDVICEGLHCLLLIWQSISLRHVFVFFQLRTNGRIQLLSCQFNSYQVFRPLLYSRHWWLLYKWMLQLFCSPCSQHANSAFYFPSADRWSVTQQHPAANPACGQSRAEPLHSVHIANESTLFVNIYEIYKHTLALLFGSNLKTCSFLSWVVY